MNGDGTYQIACTSTQWFYYTAGVWTLGTTSTGLSGMIGVAMSAETGTDSTKSVTFAGTDGFRAYYSASAPADGTLPTIATTGITNAKSLKVSGSDDTVYQIMGTYDGGVWVSRATSTGFVKYVRVGPNGGAGENFFPIGAVAATGTNFGAISVNYNRVYTASTGDFSLASGTPNSGYRFMTGMAMMDANNWYATFAGDTQGPTYGLQYSTDASASWSAYLNSTFIQAQDIAISSSVNSAGFRSFVFLSSDKVYLSGDSGVTYYVVEGKLNPATGTRDQYVKETPLKVAINSDGTRITFVTRLNIFFGSSCTYATGGVFESCEWSSVSIQTSTATYISQSPHEIHGRNGGVEYRSLDGGFSWSVNLVKTDL